MLIRKVKTMMTGNSLSRVADIALPALSGSNVMYSNV